MKVLRGLSKALDIVINTLSISYTALLLATALIVSYEVVMRKLFQVTTPWVFAFSVLFTTNLYPYFGAAVAMKYLRFIRITIQERKLAPFTTTWTEIYGQTVFLVELGILATLMARYVPAIAAQGTRSSQMEAFMMWPFYLVLAIGLYILAAVVFRHILRLIGKVRSGKLAKGKSLWGSPQFLIPLFIVGLVFSAWVYSLSPAIGLIVILLVAMFSGIPVAGGMAMVALFGFSLTPGMAMYPILPLKMYQASESSTWLAVPMFVMGGVILNRGLASDLFGFVSAWVGKMRGGIGIAAVWTAVLIGAMLGSQAAITSSLYYFCVPELDKRHYPRGLTLPMMAALTPLGGLIPPSLLMIIMGSLANLSIGALFMAGIGPGLLMAIISTVVVIIYCTFNKVETYDPGWTERFKTIPRVIPALGIPFVVVGGIMTGWSTPTEAGAIMVTYCLILSFIKRLIKLHPKELLTLGDESGKVTGYLGFSITMGGLIGAIMVASEVPFQLTNFIISSGLGKFGLFALLTFIFVLLGMFGEIFAAMLILWPLLVPVAADLMIHPWWLCVWYILMQGLGAITPPVAGGVFFMAIMTDTDPYWIFKRILPWCGMYAATVAILYIFPNVVTILPYAMGFSPPTGF